MRQAKISANFPILSLDEDALLRECHRSYAKGEAVGKGIVGEENSKELRNLHRLGLIDVLYADNTPYGFKSVTELGMRYAEDLIPERSNMNVNISPVFTSTNIASSEATALASILNEIKVSSVMRAIEDSGLEESKKRNARDAVCELEEASKTKESGRFLEALGKLVNIAKDVADLGGSIISLVAKFSTGFIQ